ncbi:MAG: glycosyltransferase family 2 protein [Planctomycetes bacterium]|nr:glycosyltransferase family 2 protein [Planctomycetota bacterium]
MDASIVIPMKNNAATIGDCLERVRQQKFNGSYETLVIDSGSTDGCIDIVRRFPVRLLEIRPEEFHHARTRNLGALETTGRAIVFLSADALPVDDTWLASLVAPLGSEGISAAYSRQVPRPGASPSQQFGYAWNYPAHKEIKRAKDFDRLGPKVFFFSNVSSAVLRPVWLEFPFREDLPVFEDAALARRLIESGHAIAYEPASVVVHSHDFSCWHLFRRYFDIGMVFRMLELEHFRPRPSRFEREGRRYLIEEIRFLAQGKKLLSLPACMARDAAKYAGYFLGHRYRWMPKFLARRISIYRREWN